MIKDVQPHIQPSQKRDSSQDAANIANIIYRIHTVKQREFTTKMVTLGRIEVTIILK